MRGLVNGLGGTVLDDWAWPDPPTTPRDVIAGHCRNWGRQLAYDFADTILTELAVRDFKIVRIKPVERRPLIIDETEKERRCSMRVR